MTDLPYLIGSLCHRCGILIPDGMIHACRASFYWYLSCSDKLPEAIDLGPSVTGVIP